MIKETTRMDMAMDKITSLELKVRGLCEQLAELTGSLDMTDDLYTAFVKFMEPTVEGLKSRVSDLEGKNPSNLVYEINCLKGIFNTLQDRVVRLEMNLNFQIDENKKISARMDRLEKKVMEPIAQQIVDAQRLVGLGKVHFTVPASRHFCERCHCHKDHR